jgi:putative ABC transport system permease protein
MFFKLAVRNIFRNKRRTLITELAIVIGVVAILFVGAFLNGMSQSWGNNLIDADSGHLSVIRSDYLENLKSHNLKLSLKNVDQLYQRFDGRPEVEASIAKLDIGGMVGTGEQSTTFFGSGLDMRRQAKALPKAFKSVAEGKGLEPNDVNGAVVGIGLAKSLNKKVGDSVLLATNTIDGQLNAIEVVIRGLYKTGQVELDDNLVIISLKAAQDLLAAPNRASRINLRLKPGVKEADAQKTLAAVALSLEPKAVLKTWIEMNPMFSQVNGMFAGIAFIVGVILFIIVAAGVANTMMMSIFERTREIGTVIAIGTEPRQVTRLFLLEALCIGGLGVVIGLTIGIGLTLLAMKTGVPWRPPSSSETMHIIPVLKIGDMLRVTVLVMFMALVASFFPAHFASKLDPIDALRRN